MTDSDTTHAASIKNARQIKSFIDTEPPVEKNNPTGPYRTTFPESIGDLLLFVPRNEIGRTISNLTGRYGYSHLAIDCGQVDVPTGRRVMIEVTMGDGVHFAFRDEYGKRPFARVPLQRIGLDVQQFCECIHAKVGEKFDNWEAVTLGILDNPARQICSDLATVCLPEAWREQVARYHQQAVLHPLSATRENFPDVGVRLFMSPNGFAEFLGVPRGDRIQSPDQLVDPHIRASKDAGLLSKLWKWSDAFFTVLWRTMWKPWLANHISVRREPTS